MNIKRMQLLVQMLNDIHQHPLIDEYGCPINWNMSRIIDRHECGTTACAFGHMPYYPAFKQDGWGTVLDGMLPSWQGTVSAVESAAAYFEITEDMADDIFVGGYSNETPTHEITVIQMRDYVQSLIDAHVAATT